MTFSKNTIFTKIVLDPYIQKARAYVIFEKDKFSKIGLEFSEILNFKKSFLTPIYKKRAQMEFSKI